VATLVQVQLNSAQAHSQGRHLPDIEALIRAAQLTPQATTWSLAVFRQLAIAEAAVHGIPPEQVHFHEVGATDAIVDIVGTCIGLDWLGIEHLYCSALPTGGGTVMAAHGRLPVPAPAVLRLLTQGQVPVFSNGIEKELVTPTGAAIATTLSSGFGGAPAMTLTAVGYGAGGRELPIANVLRLWIGQAPQPLEPRLFHQEKPGHGHREPHEHKPHEPHGHKSHEPHEPHEHKPQGFRSAESSASQPLPPQSLGEPTEFQTETVIELQTQVDDLTPQAVGYLYERLFAAGVLDVFTQSAAMKKNRPGILLTVICRPDQAQRCTQLLFEETTTLGVRCTPQQRQFLYREFFPLKTPYGEIQIKVARACPGGPILNLHPEYEDCARCARSQGVSWKQIHQRAMAQAIEQL
ncbi:MAG: nickel pincer cofactor biosynthesis protein LarC, partial [Cyanobacteria bacterium P01_A01_bin.105]